MCHPLFTASLMYTQSRTYPCSQSRVSFCTSCFAAVDACRHEHGLDAACSANNYLYSAVCRRVSSRARPGRRLSGQQLPLLGISQSTALCRHRAHQGESLRMTSSHAGSSVAPRDVWCHHIDTILNQYSITDVILILLRVLMANVAISWLYM